MMDAPVFSFYLAALLMFVYMGPTAIKRIRLYSQRDKFACTMCGTCCRFKIIHLTPSDIKRLESGGYKDFVCKKDGPRLRRQRGRCMFLTDDKCSVYGHRPQVCREFPFFKTFGIGYAQTASFCPAMEEFESG